MRTKIAIMQPYFFPYLGYFQLAAAVNKFIFYDDVNYICSGWINRNRLNLNHKPVFFTIPLREASSFKKINEIEVATDARWKEKIRRTMHHAYAKAPYYNATAQLFEDVINSHDLLIADFARKSVVQVAKHLGLETKFVTTSATYDNSALSGAERVIDICKIEGADCYVNMVGGRALYQTQHFASNNLALCFLSPELAPPRQAHRHFHPGLSILDLLMYYDVATIQQMLKQAAMEYTHTDQAQAIRTESHHVQ